MGAGIYYMVVANKVKTVLGIDTTLVSNEIKFIVEATTAVTALTPNPGDTISELTPIFSWTNNPGVPYYHIIVSDEKISPDLDNSTVEGLSIIWEAITSNTQITYGAPDPSGTLTADPPPFSPGKEYSWVVLNNYGNHPAYSSTKFSLPSSFMVEGEPLTSPKSIFPANDTVLTSLANSTIDLTWTDLDSNANTYMVYVYVSAEISDGVFAQTVVWSTEVTAGQFGGDTATVSMNASAVLTNNLYTWKVIAVDSKGAGTSGDISSFQYNTPTGTITVNTKEYITSGGDVVEKSVGLVELELEVLDGSTDAPLLYYTDNNGYFSRSRQAGSYRLTTVKDGYVSQSKSITLDDNEEEVLTFYLERPEASIFGTVVDNSDAVVNLATVTAVSDRGDTVTAETDPSGNYVLSCYAADWSISASKSSYSGSSTLDTTLVSGASVDLKTRLAITKNAYNLYGTVKNGDGDALLGVNVKLLSGSEVIATIPSTPQSGAYTFSVNSGVYTVVAEKTGFSSYSDSVTVLSSIQKTITLQAGAALLSGSIIGKSYNNDGNLSYAPITGATVLIIDTSVTPNDTISTSSDNVYGEFTKSFLGNDKQFKVVASAAGYVTDEAYSVVIENGKTYNYLDTIIALASMRGKITMATSPLGATVSLIDTASNIVATATADAQGQFEMRNIPNSDALDFRISAGAPGYVVDSILISPLDGSAVVKSNLVKVTAGQVLISANNKPVDTLLIALGSGDKALGWNIHKADSIISASIKIKSPLLKTISASDTLSGVGPNDYLLSVDATADSIIDCSFHKYVLSSGADSIHIDSVNLPIVNTNSDTMTLGSGGLTLTFTSSTTLDSAFLYYKAGTASDFSIDSVVLDTTISGISYYKSNIPVSVDGVELVYYLLAYIGADRYGYDQEVYRAFINPNPKYISKLSITPTSTETFKFAADDDVSFKLNGYNSSQYTKIDSLPSTYVSWSFIGESYGATIKSDGENVTVNTGKDGSGDSLIVLQGEFTTQSDSTYILGSGVDSVVTVSFQVSEYELDSVAIVRTDYDGRDYITTGASERAEFTAVGFDENGNKVNVTPLWSLEPYTAGTIENGVLRPSDSYFGRVQINADVGAKDVYYYQNGKRGFPINYIISSVVDTITNGLGVLQNNEGCRIEFPAGLVKASSQKKLSLLVSTDTNLISMFSNIEKDTSNIEKLSGKFDLIGDMYNISDLDAALTNNSDTMLLTLGVPIAYQEKARSGEGLYIALWNDSLKEWTPDPKTEVRENGTQLTLPVTHFSTYGLLSKPVKTSAYFDIYPNPFSPLVKPKARDGADAQFGTCFTIYPISKSSPTLQLSVNIYNVLGQRVWGTVILNATSSKKYKIWWDGKTLSDIKLLGPRQQVTPGEEGYSYKVDGEKMCRNGRYFVVLTIDDNGDKKDYMKNLILFK